MTTAPLRLLPASTLGSPPSPLERARAIRAHRAAYTTAFAPVSKLFRDPAWEILLTLFIMQEDDTAPTLSDIGETVGLTEETTRRWLMALEQTGMIEGWPREPDADRRPAATLTLAAHATMLRFLDTI